MLPWPTDASDAVETAEAAAESLALWPYPVLIAGAAVLVFGRRTSAAVQTVLLPACVIAIAAALWQLALGLSDDPDTPSPGQTLSTLGGLMQEGQIWRDSAASLFRVTWGFFLAAAVGIPLGLVMGWSLYAFRALNPLVQALRPISPIAWIPFAILYFGIGDGAGIALIFYSSFFPITVGTTAAVMNISLVHQRSARNFGLRGLELFRRVVLPAALPQIITSLRLALGVAWLVLVAAEMVGMDSGLGYLIMDARNMGKRFDLIAATIVVIGAIGIGQGPIGHRA